MVTPGTPQFSVKCDPAVYTPDPGQMRTWVDYLYDALGASQSRPFRRACVSLACGVALYLVGFLLAIPIHFVSVYVTTPGVYFVVITFAFFLGRCRSMSQQLVPLSASVRDIFAIPDEDYADKLNTIGRQATNPRVAALTTLTLLVACWGFIAVMDFVPGSDPAVYTAKYPYPFGLSWFTGHGLWIKMLISDTLTAAVVALVAPIMYATVRGLLALFPAIRTWDVIPIPAHVALRFKAVTSFFILGGLYYAIGITTALIATGGDGDPLILTVTVVFVIFGTVSVLTPIALANYLIKKSQEQLATSVSGAYYTRLFPIAISNPALKRDVHTVGADNGYSELQRLQDLLSAAIKTTGIEGQWRTIGSALLTQSLPLLSTLVTHNRALLHMLLPALPQ